MISIEINEEESTKQNMVYTLQYIAQQIEAGNTSGYGPNWRLIGEEEKEVENED